ncbi:SubName: Full=Uncharacterized protein {ECO:0000313/EMBL:CCA71761.1} [Serendipita indica DSM 11827]|nr:SubName: Full=Uncharacterized protein {ECO:0000313/EMBL:CCA71761.1} [Serendipita indica DSM 11827]
MSSNRNQARNSSEGIEAELRRLLRESKEDAEAVRREQDRRDLRNERIRILLDQRKREQELQRLECERIERERLQQQQERERLARLRQDEERRAYQRPEKRKRQNSEPPRMRNLSVPPTNYGSEMDISDSNANETAKEVRRMRDELVYKGVINKKRAETICDNCVLKHGQGNVDARDCDRASNHACGACRKRKQACPQDGTRLHVRSVASRSRAPSVAAPKSHADVSHPIQEIEDFSSALKAMTAKMINLSRELELLRQTDNWRKVVKKRKLGADRMQQDDDQFALDDSD